VTQARLRNRNSITRNSRPGCPKAGILPALKELNIRQPSFLRLIWGKILVVIWLLISGGIEYSKPPEIKR